MQEFKEIVMAIHFANLIWLIVIPAAMMGIDILTGLCYAFISNTFQSAKMRSGLGKKIGELCIIVIGLLFTFGMNLPKYILTAIALYIIFMEMMSIFENLKKLGVPIPAAVAKTLNNINDEIMHEDDIKALRKDMDEIISIIEKERKDE